MRRIIILLLCAMTAMASFAKNDEVVMTVNGKDIRSSEFEHFFRENSQLPASEDNVMECAELFLNYKLKVQAAIDAGIDRTSSFKEEYSQYRDMLAEEYLVDRQTLESVLMSSYQSSVEAVGEDGLLLLGIISLAADQNGKSRMDSIYRRLQKGDSFKELAAKCSVDEFAQRGGLVGWVSRSEVNETIGNEAFRLNMGEFSKPFVLDDVVMIVRAERREDLGSYEENRPKILEMLKERGVYDNLKIQKAEECSRKYGWNLKGEEAVARLNRDLDKIEPEFANISRDYYEGLLSFEISSREVWNKVETDEKGKEAYFNSNRDKFKFDVPCFKGMVLFCTDEAVFRRIESAVAGHDVMDWSGIILGFNKEKAVVRAMRGVNGNGIFAKGDNEYVDKLVFGEGSFKPMRGFPYVNVIGKRVTEAETMSDVAVRLTESYQEYLEQKWVDFLRKKYKFKLNRKALTSAILKD